MKDQGALNKMSTSNNKKVFAFISIKLKPFHNDASNWNTKLGPCFTRERANLPSMTKQTRRTVLFFTITAKAESTAKRKT